MIICYSSHRKHKLLLILMLSTLHRGSLFTLFSFFRSAVPVSSAFFLICWITKMNDEHSFLGLQLPRCSVILMERLFWALLSLPLQVMPQEPASSSYAFHWLCLPGLPWSALLVWLWIRVRLEQGRSWVCLSCSFNKLPYNLIIISTPMRINP